MNNRQAIEELRTVLRDVQPKKASRARKAGGGAGINFSIKGVDYPIVVAKLKGKNYKLLVVEQPEIDKFDAEGYMDGQRDVDGKLFEKPDFGFDEERQIEREITEGIREALGRDTSDWPDELDVQVDSLEFEDMMIFRGYVRGKVEKGFPFDFEGQADLYVDFDPRSTHGVIDLGWQKCGLAVEASKKMEYWYEDVFEAYGEEDEDGILV
jgi:hypothetical protein